MRTRTRLIQSLEADKKGAFLHLSEVLLRLVPVKLLAVSTKHEDTAPFTADLFNGLMTIDKAAKLVETQTIPSIIQRIMSMSAKSQNGLLAMLRMVSYLVDNEVTAIRHLDLTAWISSLLNRTKTVSPPLNLAEPSHLSTISPLSLV